MSKVNLTQSQIEFVKFLLVGGLNTAFVFFVYSFFLLLGFHYAFASLLGTILGIIFNFKTTGTLVFQNTKNGLIFAFFGVYCVVYFINVLCLKVFNYYNINLYFAGFVLLLPMALLSFFLMKSFVFGEKNV